MSDHSMKLSAARTTLDGVSREDPLKLIRDIKAGIHTAIKSGTSAEAVATSIAGITDAPARRKAVAPENRYNDNVTYVDHSPYSDGYADTYNDGRARLNHGS